MSSSEPEGGPPASAPQRGGPIRIALPPRRKMQNQWVLITGVLVTPVILAILLWLSIDRDRAKPRLPEDPAAESAAPAEGVTPDPLPIRPEPR